MTREEIIKELSVEYLGDSERMIKAKKMAIKALEQEPYFWEKCPYYEPDIMFDGKDEYDMGKCTYKQEPKIGHWEICQDDDGMYGICNICGQDSDFTHYGEVYMYCPNCGAKMESEDKE